MFSVLAHSQEKRFHFLQKNAEPSWSRKLVLVPRGNDECELGDCIYTIIWQFQ
jgi:hypothetical protein